MISRALAALVSGALFGLGLAISGMTDRFIVLGFLDPFGEFNPQLAFVLGGAVAVTVIAFRFVLRLRRPVLSSEFQLPVATAVDRRLLAGAAIFGAGWGLGLLSRSRTRRPRRRPARRADFRAGDVRRQLLSPPAGASR